MRADFTADRTDAAFQIADPGLARIQVNDGLDGIIGQRYFSRTKAILAHLARDQISLGNGNFLALGITGELDDFHPVE